MKTKIFQRKIILATAAIFAFSGAFAQININTAMTPTQLVQNVLVGGGVTVSNVQMTGTSMAYGSFTNGNTTNIGLDAGVILTCGNATFVPGPNSYSGQGSDNSLSGDADLTNLAGIITYDATVLEFDFVPLGDTIRFRYVFGSEEYPEYVFAGYNDAFGFFISGPGITGTYSNSSKNIALVPGTTTPVTIDNVNSSVNSQYYVDNTWGNTIEYDGFTKVLTAWCIVQKCQQYHIKLAIADAGDGILDSGVFLEANSFSSNNATVTPTYSNPALGNNAIEGCTDGIFAFTLPNPTTTPLTVNFTIGGTALFGTDYTTIPTVTSPSGSITIPAGQDSVALVIQAIQDGITEVPETVILTISNGCTPQIYTITIIDKTTLLASASGATTICPGNPVPITATGAGGTPTYTYNWGAAGSGASVTVSPTVTTTYTVTVTDLCGQTETASVIVTVANNLSVAISPASPATICLGGSVPLTASATGAAYTWSPSAGLSATTGATVTASPVVNSVYTVTATANGCSGTASIAVNIAANLPVTVSPNTSICPGSSTQLTASGATNYIWNPSTGLSASTGATVTASPSVQTTYTVLGSDAGGCTGSTSVTVDVTPVTATAATLTDDNCGQSNGSVMATPGTTCANFIYAWNTNPPQTSNTAVGLPAGTYTVTVSCGSCSATASATVNSIPGPTATTTVSGATCGLPNGSATVIASDGNPPYTYLWSSVPPQTGSTLSGVVAGTYFVTVTDASNCSDITSAVIPGTTVPVASASQIMQASCGMADGSAGSVVSSGNAPYSYSWNSAPPQTMQDLTGVPAGNYCVTVTDINGCTASACVVINQSGAPTATASSTSETCGQNNGTATVVAFGGNNFSYVWSTGNTGSTVTGLSSGTYYVTVTDGGCSVTTSVSVGNIHGPSADFTIHPPELTLMDGPVNFIDNSSGNPVNWEWNFGDGSPVVTGANIQYQYQEIGIFNVTLYITDINGCRDSVSDSVKIKEIFTFYIPNAFTPNGNTINDTWQPGFVGIDLNYYDCKIYNRWGKLVYSTANPYVGWNGTFNNSGTGDDVILGVYVYKIKVKELDGPRHEYIGKIVLIP